MSKNKIITIVSMLMLVFCISVTTAYGASYKTYNIKVDNNKVSVHMPNNIDITIGDIKESISKEFIGNKKEITIMKMSELDSHILPSNKAIIISSNNTIIPIDIKAEGVTGNQVKDIISDSSLSLNNGDIINIDDVVADNEQIPTKTNTFIKNDDNILNEMKTKSNSNNFYYEITNQYTKGNKYMYKDHFICSVAKGEKRHVKKDIIWSYSISTSAKYKSLTQVKVDLGAKRTRSISHTYTGPTSSKYNSREFRMKVYRQHVKVKQTFKDFYINNTKIYNFTYNRPVKEYISYSIDRVAKK